MNKTELLNEVDNKLPEMKELVKTIPLTWAEGFCEWVDKKGFIHTKRFTVPVSADRIKSWFAYYLPEGYSYTLTYREGMGALIVRAKGKWEG